MLRAKVKSIEITEVPDLKPESYVPDDCEDFQCTFCLSIGPSDADGAELFYITACTPKRLGKTCEIDGFVWGRHHLIVPHYNLKAIMQTITRFVEDCSGDSWADVALKVSRPCELGVRGLRRDP